MLSLRAHARFIRGRPPATESRVPSTRRSPRQLLAVAGMALLVSPLTPLSPPALSTNPGAASAGARVQLAGANFAHRSKVQLTWDGSTGGMPTLTVGRNGRFTATMVVPKATPGRHILGVRTVSSQLPRLRGGARVQESVIATATFSILPGSSPAQLAGDAAAGTDAPTFTPDPATGNQAPTDAPLPIATLDPTAVTPTEPGTIPAPDPTVDPTTEPTVDATPKPDPTAKPPATPKPGPHPEAGPHAQAPDAGRRHPRDPCR